MIESELFGHERGAFTGAQTRKLGKVEASTGGNLFLDEIGDLPIELQGKLLRFVQEGKFERVGGTETIEVNVRIIAATNYDLEQHVKEQKFRQDLFFRLNVLPLPIPPLRERREDIPLLARHFIRKHFNEDAWDFTPDALEAIKTHDWTGKCERARKPTSKSLDFSCRWLGFCGRFGLSPRKTNPSGYPFRGKDLRAI